jgi:hypothetical protein
MRPAPCFAPLKSAVVEPYIVTRVLRIKYRRELKTRRSSNLKRRAWGRGRHPVQDILSSLSLSDEDSKSRTPEWSEVTFFALPTSAKIQKSHHVRRRHVASLGQGEGAKHGHHSNTRREIPRTAAHRSSGCGRAASEVYVWARRSVGIMVGLLYGGVGASGRGFVPAIREKRCPGRLERVKSWQPGSLRSV